MFIPKEQPSPTDPAVIEQLKSLAKKLDDLTKKNDALSTKTAELEIRVRARSAFSTSVSRLGLLWRLNPAKLMLN